MKENDIANTFVTKVEFSEFSREVKGTLAQIENKLDVKTGTNWAVIWTAAGVIAVMVTTIAAGAWALMKANNTALEKTVGSYEARLQRIENVQDRDTYAKARYYDQIVFGQVQSGMPVAAPNSPAQPAFPPGP